MILVKVTKLGGRVNEVSLEDGATVADALRAAEVEQDRSEIRVNGSAATASTALSDGAIVSLVPAIKGGLVAFIKVLFQ